MSSAPEPGGPTARLLRRERAIVVGAIAVLAGLGVAWTASGAGMSGAMPPMAGMAGMAGAAPSLGLTTLMWSAMMVAMMLPSAAPTILLYGRVRAARAGDPSIAPSGAFLGGYLLVWLAFSVMAAGLQGLAARSGWLDPVAMRTPHRALASGALVLVGLYQLSPLKDVCLSHCRQPGAFLARHWRPGTPGALRLGVLHGAYCLGCCGLLMVLLSSAG